MNKKINVLLLGEFSGVHNNLKKGLEQQGCRVTLANDGDSYRNFDSYLKISPYKGKFFGKLLNILYFFTNIRSFIGYDIVQFINPFVLPSYYFFSGIIFLLFKYNKKVVYYACGTDPAYLRSKKAFKYFPFNEEMFKETPDYNATRTKCLYSFFLNNVSLIITPSYAYSVGYASNSVLQSRPIPFPGIGVYNTIFNPQHNRLKILFGITRRGFKGADYILDALEKIREKHSDKVEIDIVERLPFKEYLEYLQQCDVLVDQCKSYGYGMNAIFALEQGKIVLSGSEKEALDYLGVQNCPVINIIPDVDQIYQELERLVLMDREQVLSLQQQGVQYVKEYHDPTKIGAHFCSKYKELLLNNIHHQ